MALSVPATRRPKHTRTIVCDGYLRDDGMWDIEARIIDTKAYRYREPERGAIDIGAHVHNMAVRLTVDSQYIVRAIEIDMAAHPYASCLGAPPAYQGLVGKSISRGWRKIVQEQVGGALGCTHVRELLFPMATVAFQTITGWPEDDGTDKPPLISNDPSGFLNGCKAWDQAGPMVAKLYPQWSKPATTPSKS